MLNFLSWGFSFDGNATNTSSPTLTHEHIHAIIHTHMGADVGNGVSVDADVYVCVGVCE